jgi:hypothetical protein
MTNNTLPVQINNKLLLRFAKVEDANALGAFNQRIHMDAQPEDKRLAAWTEDLLYGKYPGFNFTDCTIVEEIGTGKIVSSMLLLPQTWTYAGIPIQVSRPELVGTDPDYRKLGLVRKQFEILHDISDARGDLIQGITGIPFYYRQFGYEMAVDLDGHRKAYAPQQIPPLKKDESEPVKFRPTTANDLPLVREWVEQANKNSLLSCFRDVDLWQYELNGKSFDNVNRFNLITIVSKSGEPIGILGLPHFLWGSTMAAVIYELSPEFSWKMVTPSVLRYLWAVGQEMRAFPSKVCDSVALALKSDHPAYEVAGQQLTEIKQPYAWYLRVPYPDKFLTRIASVLEKRLENTAFAGVSQELKLSFYTSGLTIRFDQGKIVAIEDKMEPDWEKADALFPNLTFLQILFGHRSCSELKYAYPDCGFKPGIAPLLDCLFPKQTSNLMALS